ncbi:hypothetical protein GC722_06150 [Auraticoccus sp. F435]|uniref:PF03932 family protein CutC n=1 Tax=Auraticoccus cholistanensis TaxID=2656650 RepID=A0A6A9USL6_9ACTN|nr:hypothetical protein [Auraticoccus cholistanensis]
MTSLELAVSDRAGVEVARAVGARRVELGVALALGGLTPSLGTLRAAVAAAGPVEVHVLVRPRGGGFRYTADEVELCCDDVAVAVEAGADGVVVGALDDEGELDLDVLRRLVAVADGLPVTVHRAVDVSADPVRSVRRLAGLGVARVLSSGGAASAHQGLPTLAAMVQAAGDVAVVAGGGVRPEHVADLAAVGVEGVHASAKVFVPAGSRLSLGSATTDGVPEGHEATDLATARRLAEAVAGVRG